MPTEEMFQVDPKAPLFPSEECTVGKASRTLLIPFNLYYIINLMVKKKKRTKSWHVPTKFILFLILLTMYSSWKL